MWNFLESAITFWSRNCQDSMHIFSLCLETYFKICPRFYFIYKVCRESNICVSVSFESVLWLAVMMSKYFAMCIFCMSTQREREHEIMATYFKRSCIINISEKWIYLDSLLSRYKYQHFLFLCQYPQRRSFYTGSIHLMVLLNFILF